VLPGRVGSLGGPPISGRAVGLARLAFGVSIGRVRQVFGQAASAGDPFELGVGAR
jgi:hypothetical protein